MHQKPNALKGQQNNALTTTNIPQHPCNMLVPGHNHACLQIAITHAALAESLWLLNRTGNGLHPSTALKQLAGDPSPTLAASTVGLHGPGND